MIRIELIPEQRETLEKARRIRSSNLAERCLAVLLSDQGQRAPAIAASMGRHEHTIRSWLKAYLQDGLDGLKATPPIGRANRKEQAAVTLLQPVLAKAPSDYGYLEAGWSANWLVDYLRRQGLEASESTVKRALKRGGWVYKRVAKTMPMEAPSAEEKTYGWTRSSAPSSRSRTNETERCCSSTNHILAMSLMCNEAGSGRKVNGKHLNLRLGKAKRSLAP